MTKSEELYKKAVKLMPGGVNSPVRAFRSVGRDPIFIKRAEGAHIFDADGKQYIDFVGSWGPMLLGHNHPEIYQAVVEEAKNGLSYGAATELEVEMAELICSLVPSIEMVRMVNSGTEAVMSAIRLARGFTKRDKIIKFEGCYHGHTDSMLVKAGSGVMTAGRPDSAGVPAGCAEDTITARYNDIEQVRTIFETLDNEIAAVIIEPVAANMGVVIPKSGFLEQLRELCTSYGAVLIFDEVITGFRLGIDGAQGFYGVTPDLTTFGKIIGGGMPVGAYGGKRELMELIAPNGPVYQAGTLSGNPVAMAAGLTQLKILKENPSIYEKINQLGDYFRDKLKILLKESDKNWTCTGIGSLSCLFFTNSEVCDYETAKTADTEQFGAYFNHMLDQGIYLAPSQFEAMFFSNAHEKEDIDFVLSNIKTFLSL